ncbi:efflux RND transporter periplasmic adaptor subunit [Agromyces ramosus]|uniref:Macrolide-specific efflux system membrane fusion protein n=1 Tax=Agromyces ramosus TaxID=33879 RepID=A0ABU0R8T6_9MICO|nr:efflux RND transporter periplasmic adaptor subunit [Agromyces ramosus]MDQ0894483.1 macrolide-specific efflux system membrane fusion protein [Agromyces ramosus]
MGVWRRWIWPVLKSIVVLVIAVALVKLAFFPDHPSDEAAISPTGAVQQPQVPVRVDTIKNDVVLTGTVNADAAVPVKATAAGAVDEVFVAAGAQVVAGDVLFDIKVENPVEPVESAGPDGFPITTVPKPTYRFEKVVAPAAGTLAALDVIAGQVVATGEEAGQVAPPSFNVSATLSPEQQYRLTTKPTEAVIAITGGPAAFTCTGLTVTTPLNGQTPDDSGAPPTSGTTVRCAVPAGVTVFAGLSAEMTIAAGSAADVLVVPTTAVKGGAESGVVFKVGEAGEPVEHPVTLGLTDGRSVQIVDGLAEGDLILEFVPGAPAPVVGPDGCVTNPNGSVECVAVGG